MEPDYVDKYGFVRKPGAAVVVSSQSRQQKSGNRAGMRPWSVFRGNKYLGTVYARRDWDEEGVKKMAPSEGYFGVTRAVLVDVRR